MRRLRDRRRRRGGLLDRLPPRPPGPARRRPPRSRAAHQRLDLPLRRPCRPAPRLGLADADDDGLRRALSHARLRLGRVRRAAAGVLARALGGEAPPGGLGPDLRGGGRAPLPAGWAKTFGLPLELLSAAEAVERFPLMEPAGVIGASWLPTDGYLDPSLLTYALAEGAREGGCDIHTNTRVTGIDVERGRVCGVRTERGDIEAEVVVDAGGMYAAEIGRMAGVRVPLVPMGHEYLVPP